VNIGIVCYASVGGSGIVATELAKCLAARGHDVHMISTDTPFRYSEYQPGLSFHRVNTPAYPLFREPQYILSLATSMVHVARARELDIIHAHYAVPHATAAYLARQILETTAKETRVRRSSPRFTALISPSSAAITRMPKRSRSRSSGPMA
jgi:glycosyltransferase involved in cell wall biosynthesis